MWLYCDDIFKGYYFCNIKYMKYVELMYKKNKELLHVRNKDFLAPKFLVEAALKWSSNKTVLPYPNL